MSLSPTDQRSPTVQRGQWPLERSLNGKMWVDIEMPMAERWGGIVLLHDDLDEVQDALGGTGRDQAVISVWWD